MNTEEGFLFLFQFIEDTKLNIIFKEYVQNIKPEKEKSFKALMIKYNLKLKQVTK